MTKSSITCRCGVLRTRRISLIMHYSCSATRPSLIATYKGKIIAGLKISSGELYCPEVVESRLFHYLNMPMQYAAILKSCENGNCYRKSVIFFLVLLKT